MQEGFNKIQGDSRCRVYNEIIQVHNLDIFDYEHYL